MRYSEFAAGLRPEDEVALVDALTLGSGWLAFAARALAADGEASTVLRALTAASTALLLARRLVSGQATVRGTELAAVLTELHQAGDTTDPVSLSWEDYLANRAIVGPDLTATLRNAVSGARRAGTVLLEDGEVEMIRLHLVEAVSSLGDARRLLV